MSSSRLQTTFTGLPSLLGKNGRFGHVIRLRFAAEAAAQQRDVAGDVFRLDAQGLRDGILHGLRILRGRPELHFAVLEFGDRDGRLHGRVRQMRHVVFGFVDFARLSRTRRPRRHRCAPTLRLCCAVSSSVFL